MASLYDNSTGKAVATFEKGKVYDNGRKMILLGTYSKKHIYEGKGFFKKCIATFDGREIVCGCDDVVGYVGKNEIYSRGFTLSSGKLGSFDSNDRIGAAAAAVLSGMFGAKYKDSFNYNYYCGSG